MPVGPIADGELAGLFAALTDYEAIGLAVSGGPDSTALMHLVNRWRSMAPAPRVVVLTVDHGLRPQSIAEVEAVTTAAARLGLATIVLRWTGEKTLSGVQEAAREARTRLLSEAAIAHRLDAIVTAHTEDDQAETLLMRLARGSGLDGLAGMPEQGLAAGIDLVRPLLGIAKARLVATLNAGAIAYVTDPSNADPRFERSRLRAAVPMLEGLGLTTTGLARSARRIDRARRALEDITDACVADSVTVDPLGVARVDLDRLASAPEEIAVRVVQRLVLATGGAGAPVRLIKIEALVEWLRDGGEGGRTLGRSMVRIGTDGPRRAIFLREIGRVALPVVHLEPGGMALWDGRFTLALDAAAEAVEIGPLAGWPHDFARGALDPRSPGLDAAPCAYRGTTLVASALDPAGARQVGLRIAFSGISRIFGPLRRGETQK